MTKTVEKPRQNRIKGKKLIFFDLKFLEKIGRIYMKYIQELMVERKEIKNL